TDEQAAILNELESLSEKTGFSKEKKNSTTDTMVTPEKVSPKSELERTLSIEETERNAIDSFRERFNTQRYEILETLGKGGMGIVQRVQDRWLEREVALKRIISKKEKEVLSDTKQAMLWRLMNEATITAKLQHPNIIPLYDMNQEVDGTLYFTMQRVHGETLSSYLKKIRKKEIGFHREKLLSIFLKICEAISYAHSEQVIHRDLKPDNIMVGQFGEVYVMDWGIAKVLKKGTKGSTDHPIQEEVPEETPASPYETIGGIGTPGYMAPEQAENAALVKPQADIYSLGKILRECSTLFSALEELSLYMEAEKLFASVFRRKKKALDYFNDKIPQDIQAIIDKATHENWYKRYRSVQNLMDDIERYQNHLRISTRKYNLLELIWKWSKRNTRLLTIGTIFFLASVSIIIYKTGWDQIQKLTQDLLKAKNSTSSISQSSLEKALFKTLSDSFDQGTEYFLTSKKRTLQQDHYYQNVLHSLSRLGAEKQIEKISEKLTKLSDSYEKNATEQTILANRNYQYYMALLAQILADFKKKDFHQSLSELREKIDPESWLRKETELALKMPPLQEKFEPDPLPDNSQEAEELYKKALENYSKKELDTSLNLLNQLNQQYPSWSEPYLYCGLIKNELKEYEQANNYWKEALKYLKNSSRKILVFEYLIKLEKDREEPAQEIFWYLELLKYHPYDTESYYQLAKCYLKKKDYPRAIQQYNIILYLEENPLRIYFDRGYAYWSLDRKEEAKSDFKDFLAKSHSLEETDILAYREKVVKFFPELNEE
ncbi:MAG: protein kinase, partial [Planctomycetota bacterium]